MLLIMGTFPPLVKNVGSVAASNLLHRSKVCGVDVVYLHGFPDLSVDFG